MLETHETTQSSQGIVVGPICVNQPNPTQVFMDYCNNNNLDPFDEILNISQSTDALRYQQVFIKLYDICYRNMWGDPFSYARSREILLAGQLGHQVYPDFSGPDAIWNNQFCEYKTTTQNRISGSYTGISYFPDINDQLNYIENEKIGCIPHHFFARFDGPYIDEIWYLTGPAVVKIITPKIIKQHRTISTHRDPRPSATVTKEDLTLYGTQIR